MILKKEKIIGTLTAMIGVVMICIGISLQQPEDTLALNLQDIEQYDVKNIAVSANKIVKDNKENKEQKKEKPLLTEVVMETAPASVIVPPRVEVYEGKTLEEVAAQIDKNLKNEIAGKGTLIASKSIELGVDPFVATAIILHETGCGQNSCSQIARNCYNFGGQKGSGCGAYQRYGSVDEGLEGMISNLYRNYYSKGLTTVEAIGPRYAESGTWVSKINGYVGNIKYN